ncbi:hypothetical protein IWW35_003989 [Coemansia sp. RSA 1878]|nr:hypothetical protein IWW35_003989 [Coemansia sp. RSA 1878]
MTTMPVYFVSHGGPNLLDDTEYPPNGAIASGLRAIGDEIKALSPRGMVVVSGHWEAGASSLQVSGIRAEPLIYDFYGFPALYYKQQFPHTVDPQLSQRVAELFKAQNVPIDTVARGLDHGAWVVLKKAGLANAPFPIIQLSLYKNESMDMHVQLGETLAELKKEGIVVVGSGMAVHNLRDLFGSRSTSLRSYVEPFDKQIEQAVLGPSSERKNGVLQLKQLKLLRQAHPTLEHLMPLHVAVGAAGDQSKATKMLEAYQVSMSWSCYRFD